MANHKQALKRHRQSLVRRQRNRATKRRMQTYIKKAQTVGAGSDQAATDEALREAVSEIAKVASKGVIPKKRASRKISRLMKALNRK